jgi:hypothetical protein
VCGGCTFSNPDTETKNEVKKKRREETREVSVRRDTTEQGTDADTQEDDETMGQSDGTKGGRGVERKQKRTGENR